MFAAVCVLNAPGHLIIRYLEQRALWADSRLSNFVTRQPRGIPGLRDISRRFSIYGDIRALFDSAPPQSTLDEINDTNDLDDEEQVDVAAGPDGPMLSRTKSRRDSMARFGGLKEQLRDLPHGAAYSDNDSASDTGTRLDRVEESIKRIERMLGKLVANQMADK